MSNLEFLRYLEECKILCFEDTFDPKRKDNALTVGDRDWWNEILIWFDNEGNVIKID